MGGHSKGEGSVNAKSEEGHRDWGRSIVLCDNAPAHVPDEQRESTSDRRLICTRDSVAYSFSSSSFAFVFFFVLVFFGAALPVADNSTIECTRCQPLVVSRSGPTSDLR